MKIKLFFLLSLGWLFFSCNHDQPVSLDSWIGNYTYEEEPVKANAGYAMVMEWSLLINKQNDTCSGIVEINGQQTYMKLRAAISGDTNTIAITYKNTIEGGNENLHYGDTLFLLSKKGDALITKWKLLEPRLSPAHEKECDCFIPSMRHP